MKAYCLIIISHRNWTKTKTCIVGVDGGRDMSPSNLKQAAKSAACAKFAVPTVDTYVVDFTYLGTGLVTINVT